MGKKIAMTYAYQSFRDNLNAAESDELDCILMELESSGRLEAPYGEKVAGHQNLFEIRIRRGGNAREFYCYDDGEYVWLLNGFEKKTRRTPPAEIKKALRIKKEYGL